MVSFGSSTPVVPRAMVIKGKWWPIKIHKPPFALDRQLVRVAVATARGWQCRNRWRSWAPLFCTDAPPYLYDGM